MRRLNERQSKLLVEIAEKRYTEYARTSPTLRFLRDHDYIRMERWDGETRVRCWITGMGFKLAELERWAKREKPKRLGFVPNKVER